MAQPQLHNSSHLRILVLGHCAAQKHGRLPDRVRGCPPEVSWVQAKSLPTASREGLQSIRSSAVVQLAQDDSECSLTIANMKLIKGQELSVGLGEVSVLRPRCGSPSSPSRGSPKARDLTHCRRKVSQHSWSTKPVIRLRASMQRPAVIELRASVGGLVTIGLMGKRPSCAEASLPDIALSESGGPDLVPWTHSAGLRERQVYCGLGHGCPTDESGGRS